MTQAKREARDPVSMPARIDTRDAIKTALEEFGVRMEHKFVRDGPDFASQIAAVVGDKFEEFGWIVMPRSMLDYNNRKRRAANGEVPYVSRPEKASVPKEQSGHARKPSKRNIVSTGH